MYVYIFSLYKLGSFIIVWIYFDRRIGFIWKCIVVVEIAVVVRPDT